MSTPHFLLMSLFICSVCAMLSEHLHFTPHKIEGCVSPMSSPVQGQAGASQESGSASPTTSAAVPRYLSRVITSAGYLLVPYRAQLNKQAPRPTVQRGRDFIHMAWSDSHYLVSPYVLSILTKLLSVTRSPLAFWWSYHRPYDGPVPRTGLPTHPWRTDFIYLV